MASIDGERLSERHRAELDASGITDDQIEARGYETITNPKTLPAAFTGGTRVPGLLFPIRNTQGETVAWQLKPDEPWLDKHGKPAKYLTAGPTCLDVPGAARPYLLNPDATLWITEGVKKVDSAVCHGIPCIVGVQGVWMWQGEGVALPDWNDIALKERDVVIAFDSDVMTKATVRRALDALAAYLAYRGARVRFLVMPDLPDGSKCGLDDAFVSGLARADLEAMLVDKLPEAGHAWETPIPLDSPAGPPLPLAAVPPTMRDMVAGVSGQLQAPSDLAFGTALGVISIAAAGKFAVRYQPTNWLEPLVAMTLPVAEPGSNKSGVLRAMAAKLSAWEEERIAEAAGRLDEWESKERVLQARLAAAEKGEGKPRDDGKTSDGEALRKLALDELQRHRDQKPVIPDLYGDDATPESIKLRMAEQGGAYGILSAESAFLSIAAGGRYNRGDPNLDVLLNGHAGDALKITRVGKPTIIVRRAYLPMCLMVQPAVIPQLGAVPGIVERGVAARLLPAFPADTVGQRETGPRPPIDPDVLTAWETAVGQLLGTARGPDPQELQLSPGAERAFTAYRAWLEPRIPAEGPEMRGWLAKLAGHVLRIAGLFHVLEHDRPVTVPISERTIRDAIDIGTYFHEHARIMFRMMAGRGGDSLARQVLDAIRAVAASGDPLTKRNVHRRLQDRTAFQRSDDLNDPLSLLEDYGWIRTEREGKSLMIELNPLENPDNTDNDTTETPSGPELSVLSGSHGTPENVTDFSAYQREPLAPTGTDGEWSVEL